MSWRRNATEEFWAKFDTAIPDKVHGTVNGYACPRCTKANTDYRRERRHRRRIA